LLRKSSLYYRRWFASSLLPIRRANGSKCNPSRRPCDISPRSTREWPGICYAARELLERFHSLGMRWIHFAIEGIELSPLPRKYLWTHADYASFSRLLAHASPSVFLSRLLICMYKMDRIFNFDLRISTIGNKSGQKRFSIGDFETQFEFLWFDKNLIFTSEVFPF